MTLRELIEQWRKPIAPTDDPFANGIARGYAEAADEL